MLADLNRLGSSFGLALATHGADHAGWRVYRATDALSRSCIDLLLCEHLDDHVGSDDIIDDLCAALITHLIRSNEPDIASQESIKKDSELVGRIHEYVAQHYREGRLSALADELGYDTSYLSAYIKRETARTFKQLVNEERMRRGPLLPREPRGSSAISGAKRREGNYVRVRSGIVARKLAGTHEHGHESRLGVARRRVARDLSAQTIEGGKPALNPVFAQLYLYAGPTAIAQFDDCIHLETIGISVVPHGLRLRLRERRSIHHEIVHTERLKQHAEQLPVNKQAFWCNLQKVRRQRRVGKIALRFYAQAALGTHGRVPPRHLLDHVKRFKSFNVSGRAL